MTYTKEQIKAIEEAEEKDEISRELAKILLKDKERYGS
jgi:hypothetical protein